MEHIITGSRVTILGREYIGISRAEVAASRMIWERVPGTQYEVNADRWARAGRYARRYSDGLAGGAGVVTTYYSEIADCQQCGGRTKTHGIVGPAICQECRESEARRDARDQAARQ